MIHSGQPARDFIDSATRHVLLRQGVLGIKVKIMRGNDPDGKSGLQKSLPDTFTVIEPKEEAPPGQPSSQDYVCLLQKTPLLSSATKYTDDSAKHRVRRLRLPVLPPRPLLRSRLLRRISAPRQEAKELLIMPLPSMPLSTSPRRRLLLLRIMVDGKKYI